MHRKLYQTTNVRLPTAISHEADNVWRGTRWVHDGTKCVQVINIETGYGRMGSRDACGRWRDAVHFGVSAFSASVSRTLARMLARLMCSLDLTRIG